MKRTFHKWFWAWSFDKEEKWLNEMAAKGLTLVAVGFCTYTFEETPPGEYDIRLELLENLPTHSESKDYIAFIEETGAEYVGSLIRWTYFRKKKCLGEFNMYSDTVSRIKHLNRILTLLGIISILNLFYGVVNIGTYFQLHATTANLVIGSLCLSFGLFIGFGFLRINRMKRKLRKDQQIFE